MSVHPTQVFQSRPIAPIKPPNGRVTPRRFASLCARVTRGKVACLAVGRLLYQVYPRSFADSNGDGIGDLRGVASKLDHLAWLGVDAIWSSPTFPSPNVDWGYDVSDYRDVHPELGTLDDLDTLIAQPCKRGRHEGRAFFRDGQAPGHGDDPKPTVMGEAYVTLATLPPYFQNLDLAQNFEFTNAEFELDQLRPIVEKTLATLPAGATPLWFASNHDVSRLATRWAYGDEARARAALFLILTLPGDAILFQRDEIPLEDGEVPDDAITDLADPPRDPERTPLPWTRSGKEWVEPWLPLENTKRNVEDQRADPDSTLNFVRDVIAQRKQFSDESYETLESVTGVWAYRRGDKTCLLNMTGDIAGHEGQTLQPWQGLIL